MTHYRLFVEFNVCVNFFYKMFLPSYIKVTCWAYIETNYVTMFFKMIIKSYIKNCKNILRLRTIEKLKSSRLSKSVDARLPWVSFFSSKLHKYKTGDLDSNVFSFKFSRIYRVNANLLHVFSICISTSTNCDDDDWSSIFVYLHTQNR